MEYPTTHPLLHRPDQMDNIDLVRTLVGGYYQNGVEFVRPIVFGSDPVEQTLQRRLQRVQEEPMFQPEIIAGRYIAALQARNPDARRIHDGLDGALNQRGQSAVREGFLKELQLTKIEQILLLRGVALATAARRREAEVHEKRVFSNRQQGLQDIALNSIRHFASNRVRVPKQRDDEGSLQRFTADYASAYIAELIEKEVKAEQLPEQYNVCSVVEAMRIPIPFGQLISKHSDKRLSVFTVEVSENRGENEIAEFQPRHITEIDESRIVNLKRLQGLLGGTFTSYTLFDTMRPIEYVEGEPIPKKPRKPVHKPKGIPLSDGDQQEKTDYVVLEMATPDENGHVDTHVVADNATVGNACFALRQEVIDEWERLVGIRFTWQNIFAPKKETVVQFGTKRIVHNPASDVPARVKEYLTQDGDTVIKEAFSRIFDRQKGRQKALFDDDMNPTTDNKLPRLFIKRIQDSEILRTFWPVIREYGYAQVYTMMRAIERGELVALPEKKAVVVKNDDREPTPEVVQQKAPAKTDAAKIWEAIVEQQLRELYGR